MAGYPLLHSMVALQRGSHGRPFRRGNTLTNTVNGTAWASRLSSKLGYAVTDGEPYYTAGCTSPTQCVFPNAQIPKAPLSPVAVNTLRYIPVANGAATPGPTYSTSSFNSTLKDDEGSARISLATRFGSLFGYSF